MRLALAFKSDRAYAQVFEKFVSDRRDGKSKPSLPLDVISDREWSELARKVERAMPGAGSRLALPAEGRERT
jgi:hypothetical protein